MFQLVIFQVNNMPTVTVKVWQERGQFELEYGDDAEYVQGYVVKSLREAIAIYESGRPPVPELSSLKCFSKEYYPSIES